jgi:hypothetical protein
VKAGNLRAEEDHLSLLLLRKIFFIPNAINLHPCDVGFIYEASPAVLETMLQRIFEHRHKGNGDLFEYVHISVIVDQVLKVFLEFIIHFVLSI